MLKLGLAVLLLVGATGSAFAQKITYVKGHYRSNGVYVKGYYKTTQNYTKSDNFSTKGNLNPYTGKVGTRTYSNYGNYGLYLPSKY